MGTHNSHDEIAEWAAYRRVLAEYEGHKDREILVRSVVGHTLSGRIEVLLDPPARARVGFTPEEQLYQRNFDWIDPIWSIVLLEERAEVAGMTGLGVYATGHDLHTGQTSPPAYEDAGTSERSGR